MELLRELRKYYGKNYRRQKLYIEDNLYYFDDMTVDDLNEVMGVNKTEKQLRREFQQYKEELYKEYHQKRKILEKQLELFKNRSKMLIHHIRTIQIKQRYYIHKNYKPNTDNYKICEERFNSLKLN